MSKCKLVQRQQIFNRLNVTKTKNFNNDLEGFAMSLRNEAYSKPGLPRKDAILLYCLCRDYRHTLQILQVQFQTTVIKQVS